MDFFFLVLGTFIWTLKSMSDILIKLIRIPTYSLHSALILTRTHRAHRVPIRMHSKPASITVARDHNTFYKCYTHKWTSHFTVPLISSTHSLILQNRQEQGINELQYFTF